MIVDRNHFIFSEDFTFFDTPDDGFIFLTSVPEDDEEDGSFFFPNNDFRFLGLSRNQRFLNSTSLGGIVTLLNSTTLGEVLIIRDEIVFTYNLTSPVNQPDRYTFLLNSQVVGSDGRRFNNEIPLFRGTIELIPPGMCYIISSERCHMHLNILSQDYTREGTGGGGSRAFSLAVVKVVSGGQRFHYNATYIF